MKKVTILMALMVLLASLAAAFTSGQLFYADFMAASHKVDDSKVKETSIKDKPGFPYVNFSDPKPALEMPMDASQHATVTAAAAADFDSDGMQDIVTVDTAGRVNVLSGNINSLFPGSERGAEVVDSTAKAFSAVKSTTQLPFAPDDIIVGDFNADGRSDVVAVKVGFDALILLPGDGLGNFLPPINQFVGGTVISAVAGEIGRPDGQADIAATILIDGKPFAAVCEHPEGAFSHKPEYFPLAAAASSLTIGQLDSDPYGDVAVVGGEILTVIHGRGQAYPLDMLPDSNITRPAAAVRSMKLPFTGRSIIASEMDGTRGDGMAILATDGSVHYLKADRESPLTKTRPKSSVPFRSAGFIPAGVNRDKFVVSDKQQPKTAAEADAAGQLMANTDEIKSEGLTAVLEKQSKARAADRAKLPTDQVVAEDSVKAAKQIEISATRKRLFEQGLAAKPVEFSKWKMTNLASDQRLSAAAVGSSAKLIMARVSTSGVDDLLIVDRSGDQIAVVGRWPEKDEKAVSGAHVTTLAAGAQPSVVVPMRLNVDGMSDLVTFNEGSSEPTVLLSRPATVFTVNTADDVGGGNCQNDGQPCSLRRALFWANLSGNNFIAFNIPGAGVHTIHLANTQLPDIVTGTTLDATTQPSYIGKPLIEIKGDLMSGAKEGLRTARPNVTIRGFAINEMPGIYDNGSVIAGSGIVILSYIAEILATNVTIESNFLGTDPQGVADKGNDGNGIQIYDADSNNIGGTAPQARNILSGNGSVDEEGTKPGVGFTITGGNYNKVYNNYVGTDVTGSLILGNYQGAFVSGFANEIGGDQPGMGNVISGNGSPVDGGGHCSGRGLWVNQLYSLDTGEPLTNSTNIKGNLIGTSANGLFAVRNCTTGVTSIGNLNTFIGSVISEGRNTISGNDWDAVWCGENESAFFLTSGGCYLLGNEIGTNINGNAAIPNTEKNNTCVGFCLITETVWLPTFDTDFAVVGGPGGTAPDHACQGNCNLISGNRNTDGFGGGSFQKSGHGFGLILDNFIGTNRTGTQALANNSGGLGYAGPVLIGALFVDGQGGFIPAGNLISGNDGGAYIQSFDVGGAFYMKANVIGFSADGLSSLPNGGLGSDSSQGLGANAGGGTSIYIGGPNPLERNYIGYTSSITLGNGDGINIFAQTSSIITVQGNYIGLDRQGNAAPNTGDGVESKGEGRTIIGGGGLGTENTIANNGRAGVFIYNYTGPFTDLKTSHVTVRGNIIRSNGGLGIDLTNIVSNGGIPTGGDGVTANDCQDFDSGANGLQNYPELYAPIQNQDGTLRIDTILRSIPSRRFVIDYYQNNQADPTNYGEGATYLGSKSVMTNGNGFVSVSTNTTQQLPVTAIITATATDDDGNTSEFSCAAGLCTQAGSFSDAINTAEQVGTCIQPIVVNVTGDEPDIDGENPVQNRDGLCDVNASTPGEQCTLRAAIQEANARPGFDLINFAIPGGGIHTITIPNSILPDITQTVEINAVSQPGYNGTPLIQVTTDGSMATGLTIFASGVRVRGLAINRFSNTNINILNGVPDTKILSCFIGLNADGSADLNAASQFGIVVRAAQNTMIGSTYEGNTIANNGVGIIFSGTRGATVIGNKIGTDPSGTAAIPNGRGISLIDGATNNTIGGELESDANVISGNREEGIAMFANASVNKVKGNYIGTRTDGISPLPNGGEGIFIGDNAHDNTIGGPYAYRNILGPYNGQGADDPIIILGPSTRSNTIVGNYIGMAKDGNTVLGGGTGILVFGSNNTIGGNANAPNVFGVTQVGIAINSAEDNTPAIANKITYNRIGTNASGTSLVGISEDSRKVGIYLVGEVSSTQINNNLISGNVIGVLIKDGVALTNISNNKIGTTLDGNSDLPNNAGIVVNKSNNNLISGNLISGNLLVDVELGVTPTQPGRNEGFERRISDLIESLARLTPQRQRGSGSQYTSGNMVRANRIGTNASGDAGINNYNSIGVKIGENARGNIIGGNRRSGEGNYIAGHTGVLTDTNIGIYIGYQDNEIPNQELLPRGNKIQGNLIGWGVGFTEIPNGTGIKIKDAAENIVGADPECQAPDCIESDYGNYIANSAGAGIEFDGAGTVDNNVRGNFLGVKGNFTVGGFNTIDGILYRSPGHNTISDNLIANNQRDGVHVEGHRSFTLEDNYIAGNGENGVAVVGDGTPRSPSEKGMHRPDGSSFMKIIGNTIGMMNIGSSVQCAANSVNGILIDNIGGVLIDKSPSGHRNVVGCNGEAGIKIVGGDATEIQIINATIGTDAEGNSDRGNGGDGIRIDGASGNTVGGVGSGNVVAGNTGNGISIENANNTTVIGNNVGIVPLQTSVKLPNQKNGVALKNASNNFLGGISPAVTNVISGNTQNGVLITGPNSAANKIMRNVLGTDLSNALGIGNDQNGVRVSNRAHNNGIGGEQPDYGNTITGNGGSGILIDDETDTLARPGGGNPPEGNTMTNNSIFLNTGPGIVLGSNGFVFNDPLDADGGPNRLQNYPEITDVLVAGGQVSLLFKVPSRPDHSNYGNNGLTVQIFLADAGGEGQTLLGTESWTVANYGTGNTAIGRTYTLPPGTNPATVRITGTATDADGNTSEFYPSAAPTAAGVNLSGRVMSADGRGIRQTRVIVTGNSLAQPRFTVTGRGGLYSFEDLQAGETYIVTVGSRRYTFSTSSRVISLVDNVTDVDFVAEQ